MFFTVVNVLKMRQNQDPMKLSLPHIIQSPQNGTALVLCHKDEVAAYMISTGGEWY